MSFAPCKDSLYQVLSEKNPDHFNKIVNDANSIHSDVHSSIGQDLSIEQVREKLSGEVGSPASKGGGFSTNFSADDILDDIMWSNLGPPCFIGLLYPLSEYEQQQLSLGAYYVSRPWKKNRSIRASTEHLRKEDLV